MADDGMLLNFSIATDSLVPQTKFKGGSWKDRFLLKKAAKTRTKTVAVVGPPASNLTTVQKTTFAKPVEESEFPEERASKRRREQGSFTPAGRPNTSTPNSGSHARHQPSKGPREVVSSLFSYNPKPSNPVEEPSADPELPTAPTNAPLPDGIDTFTSLGLSAAVATHLMTKMNLKNPTAIQKSSVSQLVKDDSDAFIQSETGSGKTLAYLLPIVQRIMTLTGKDGNKNVQRDSGLFAVVLAPTRELCKQILVVLEKLLGCAHWIVAGNVIGGEKKKSEKARLRKGLNILVATPGRLVDHLTNTKVLDVSSVRWLVLDEGDRLMDLGFDEDISKIIGILDQRKKQGATPGLPDRRTTVLCSATMKMTVQRLGEISLKNAILIKSEDGSTSLTSTHQNDHSNAFLAPAQLKQSYTIVASKLRLVTLVALLKRTFARKGSVMKAIVFVSCADSVEFHFNVLTRSVEESELVEKPSLDDNTSKIRNEEVASESIRHSPLLSSTANTLTIFKLHGSLPQPIRTSIIKSFSSATSPSLLIATDVASRGLDLPNLDLVIEYDPPFSSEDHLHRIGRTARLGRDGRAIIFLLPGAEEGYVDVLKSSYRSSAEDTRAVTQMEANEILKKGFTSTSSQSTSNPKDREQLKDWERAATDFQLDVERWLVVSQADHDLARKAFQSHVRAYATHVAAERKWFDIKELHLGHLAKAFGLRDAPGRMNVPGMGNRRSQSDAGGKRKRAREGSGIEKVDTQVARNETTAETEESARKMKLKIRNRKMMMGGGADEFNIA